MLTKDRLLAPPGPLLEADGAQDSEVGEQRVRKGVEARVVAAVTGAIGKEGSS